MPMQDAPFLGTAHVQSSSGKSPEPFKIPIQRSLDYLPGNVSKTCRLKQIRQTNCFFISIYFSI